MSSPFIIVIFGATGDLARNKLIPALFSLFQQDKLGQQFYIVGFARRPFSDIQFRQMLKMEEHFDHASFTRWEDFSQNIYYQQGMFDQKPGYEELTEELRAFDKSIGACIARLFYLATPPDNYETILTQLSKRKLSQGCGHKDHEILPKIIIEKPFGKDLQTAVLLDKKLAKDFREEQIFRVDHYLGKETVQNMITFRFANSIFEPIWNKEYIDHVQITFAEKKGVGRRGAFFDGVGILRDVTQNHLMQLLATVVMEQPKSFSREAIRDARAKAIQSIICIEPEDVVKNVIRGQHLGYRKEKDVARDSMTETFAAMKLFVDTPRFKNVPFYLRAGKEMAKNVVEISIVFIQTCHILFAEIGCPEEGNVLTIRIGPDEGIALRVIAKKPGSQIALGTVDMKFSYHEEFGGHGIDAYEKLLLDILAGDQMLFNRSDELESSWDFITKILQGWQIEDQKSGYKIPIYKPGTWGPKEANALIDRDNRRWL